MTVIGSVNTVTPAAAASKNEFSQNLYSLNNKITEFLFHVCK